MKEKLSPFLQLAEQRRSVRSYLPDDVPRVSIDRCLEAARLAPSANNGQPWEFVVVTEAETKRKLADAARFGPLGANPFAADAPVIIAVNETPGHRPTRWGGKILGRDFPLMDIGMAVMQFCLQATEEGLGTCILGLFAAREIRQALHLPAAHKPRLLLTMGVAGDDASGEKKRKAKDSMSRYIEDRGI